MGPALPKIILEFKKEKDGGGLLLIGAFKTSWLLFYIKWR